MDQQFFTNRKFKAATITAKTDLCHPLEPNYAKNVNSTNYAHLRKLPLKGSKIIKLNIKFLTNKIMKAATITAKKDLLRSVGTKLTAKT